MILKRKGNIGKKGFFDDTAELFIAVAGIVVIGIIILMFISIGNASKNRNLDTDISYIDAQQNTRMMLNHELKPGYKIYHLVIDSVNGRDFSPLTAELKRIMNENYDPNNRDAWFFYVDGTIVYKHNIENVPLASLKFFDPIYLPNPEGKTIHVIFKKVTASDYKFEDKTGAENSLLIN